MQAGDELTISRDIAVYSAGSTSTAIDGSTITAGWRRYIVTLLCLTSLLNFLDRQIFAILLQPMKTELGTTDTQMGLLTGGSFALLYVIAGLPLARLADRGIRRTIIGATLLVWCSMTLVCGLARSYGEILLARMGVALGEAGSLPASYSMLPDLYPPKQRASVIGLIYCTGWIGIALSLAVGGFLNEAVGWRRTLIFVAIPGFLLGLLVLFTMPEPARREEPVRGSIRAALDDAWRFPSFRIVLVIAMLTAFAGYGIMGWAPTFLIRVHGMTTTEVGQVMSVGMVCGGLGAIVSGWLTDRLAARDQRWLFGVGVIGLLLSLPPIVGFLYMPLGPLTFICYALFLFLFGSWQPGVFAVAVNLPKGHNRALATSIVMMFQNLGGVALGPLVVGALNDAWAKEFGALAIRYSLTVILIGIIGASLAAAWGATLLRRDNVRAAQAT